MKSDFIQPITTNDFDLYQQFFQQTSSIACYGNSWSYITQACRKLGLGYKYYDRDILISIGKHHNHFVIVRPLGNIDHRFIELLKYLYDLSGQPIFIKKIFNSQTEQLNAKLFSEIRGKDNSSGTETNKYVWDEKSIADDDTYPELIFNLEMSLGIDIPHSQWLKNYQDYFPIQLSPQQSKTMSKSYQEFKRRIRQFKRLEKSCYLKIYEPLNS